MEQWILISHLAEEYLKGYSKAYGKEMIQIIMDLLGVISLERTGHDQKRTLGLNYYPSLAKFSTPEEGSEYPNIFRMKESVFKKIFSNKVVKSNYYLKAIAEPFLAGGPLA